MVFLEREPCLRFLLQVVLVILDCFVRIPREKRGIGDDECKPGWSTLFIDALVSEDHVAGQNHDIDWEESDAVRLSSGAWILPFV